MRRRNLMSVVVLVFVLLVTLFCGVNCSAEIQEQQTQPEQPAQVTKDYTFGEVGGYPKPMGFRRISWDSMDDLMFQDRVVVGLARGDRRE